MENEKDLNNAIPISLAADAMCKLKGSKTSKPQMFNPFMQRELVRSAREEIPQETADVVMSLAADNLLPQWVQECLNMDTVMLSASDK